MKEIKLTQNKIALVDDDDFEILNQYKWCAVRVSGGSYYAARKQGKKKIYMHKELLKVPKNRVVDHIDGNTLNNCMANLRECSIAENVRNQKIRSTNTTGFKGVSYYKNRNMYAARIMLNYRAHFIGLYYTPEGAARAYNQRAKELFGEYALLNIV